MIMSWLGTFVRVSQALLEVYEMSAIIVFALLIWGTILHKIHAGTVTNMPKSQLLPSYVQLY